MDIYWVENKEKRGPSTVPDVIRRIQLGEIEEACLAWHVGCEKWTPIKELPALREYINVKTPPKEEDDDELATQKALLQSIAEKYAEQQSALSTKQNPEALKGDKSDAEANEKSDKDESESSQKAAIKIIQVEAPSAQQRFFARMIDINLYMMTYMFCMYMLNVPYSLELVPSSVFAWLPYILIETIFLHLWGKTPGKTFMGIDVHYAAKPEKRIPFSQCLRRSVMVYVFGMGMMVFFPFLTIITLTLSWRFLRSRGITLWDHRCKCIISKTKPISSLRNIGATAICIIAFFYTSKFLTPWIPSYYTSINEKSPEAAAIMRDWMPKEIQEKLPLNPVIQKITPGLENFAPRSSSSSVND